MDTKEDVYRIELICQTKPFKKQKWQLELSSKQVGLRDAGGDHVLVESPEMTTTFMKVPGLSSETSNLGFILGETELAFKIARQDLEVVRQYVDTVVAASGSVELDEVRKRATGKLVRGLLLMIVCLGILVPMLVAGKANGGGTRWLFIGVVTGLVMTFQGIAGLKRHRKLVAMQEEADEAEPGAAFKYQGLDLHAETEPGDTEDDPTDLTSLPWP